jgi:hypothetical protein
MTRAKPEEHRSPSVQQDIRGLGISHRIALISAFALVYPLLVLAGLSLRGEAENLTIIWPAAGFPSTAWLVRPLHCGSW